MPIEQLTCIRAPRPKGVATLGIMCSLLIATAAHANTPESNALAHNAAFEAGAATGLSPQSTGEMLTCAAMWDRWDYAVSSAVDRKFTGSLRRELAAGNAKKRKIFWQRQARRDMRDEDSLEYFNRSRGRAEAQADKTYAAYVNNEERGLKDMMSWLAMCK